MRNSTIKIPIGVCVRCEASGDSSEKPLAHKALKLCQYHNDKRKHEERKEAGKIPTIVKRAKSIRRISSRRRSRVRKINEAKEAFRQKIHLQGYGLQVCESCGAVGQACGVSHTISEREIFSSPEIPDEEAWNPENFTYECHTGNNCHATTEAVSRDTYRDKFNQRTFWRKMRYLKKWKSWLYEDIIEQLQLQNNARERL